MAHPLDTGVLLRLVNAQDEMHAVVRQAVQCLLDRQEELFTTTQDVAEYWNVATRAVDQNGLGLPIATAANLLETIIEATCAVLVEQASVYGELKRLVRTYNVSGKQVHDARLTAMMIAWKVDAVLTLNDRDFRRYEPEGIAIVTPSSLAQSG